MNAHSILVLFAFIVLVLGGCGGVEARVTARPKPSVPEGTWKGQCGGVKIWSEATLDLTLTFSGGADALEARGDVLFVNRSAQVLFTGRRLPGGGYTLQGVMVEKGGLKTEWMIKMTIEPPSDRGQAMTGALWELPMASEPNLMCDIVWSQ